MIVCWRKIKNADHFFNSRQKFCEVFFHKTASQVLFRCFLPFDRPLPPTAAARPLKRKKGGKISPAIRCKQTCVYLCQPCIL